MGIELRTLWTEFGGKYQMRLAAGKEGLSRQMDWVHIIEDAEVARFLHGNELVFTTGIGMTTSGSLQVLAEGLYRRDACGLVVNLGPYIRELPPGLVSFCEKKAFPLFTIPWEVRLVDVTRAFSTRINENEFRELNLTEAVRNAIFYSELPKMYLPYMRRGGCRPEAGFRAAAFWMKEDLRQFPDAAFRNRLIRSRLGEAAESSVLFEQEGILILVFYGEGTENAQDALEGLADFAASRGLLFFAGIGGFVQDASGLAGSYEQAVRTRRLAERLGKRVLSYENLGSYKVILGCPDQALLASYAEELLGGVLAHDREHNTGYLAVLRDYLESGGSVSRVAEKYYCHRNTITYQINKIKGLCGADLEDAGVRADLLFAFRILDCLD